jgi:hypothetical protein
VAGTVDLFRIGAGNSPPPALAKSVAEVFEYQFGSGRAHVDVQVPGFQFGDRSLIGLQQIDRRSLESPSAFGGAEGEPLEKNCSDLAELLSFRRSSKPSAEPTVTLPASNRLRGARGPLFRARPEASSRPRSHPRRSHSHDRSYISRMPSGWLIRGSTDGS